jgi:hypothetical protein
MPSPQARLDLDRVLRTIDAKAAVVILVGDHGELETVTMGIDNDAAIFEICHSIAIQIGAEIFDNLPAEKRREASLVLPTAEDARRLGILKTKR